MINEKIHIDIPYTIGIDIPINDDLIIGKPIVGYPYMTTNFMSLLRLKRDEYCELEDYLRAHAEKRYDVFRTEKLVPCDGMSRDNKQTFTVSGLAFQFWNSTLAIGLEAGMKVGHYF